MKKRPARLWGPLVPAAAGVAGLSLLVSACGGGSSGAKVAQVASTTPATTSAPSLTGRSKRDAMVAFSACMRKNGVPKFPDPEVVDGGMRLSFGSENGIDPNAPQFKKARQACRSLLPNGGRSDPQEQAKELQKALDFAACMRSHGVPKFPDPKASGDGAIDMGGFGPDVGVDPNSPQFQAAQRECQKLLPGVPPPVKPGPGKRS
jgi:hypothetical protein